MSNVKIKKLFILPWLKKTKTIKEITVDKKCFSKILGLEIESNFIISKLKELGCEVSEKNKDLIVVPPSWRPDIKIKEDLVEEIARIYGFEKIPSQKMSLTKNKKINSVSNNFLLTNKLKKNLTSRNIMETITWSFLDKSINDDFNQVEDIKFCQWCDYKSICKR